MISVAWLRIRLSQGMKKPYKNPSAVTKCWAVIGRTHTLEVKRLDAESFIVFLEINEKGLESLTAFCVYIGVSIMSKMYNVDVCKLVLSSSPFANSSDENKVFSRKKKMNSAL